MKIIFKYLLTKNIFYYTLLLIALIYSLLINNYEKVDNLDIDTFSGYIKDYKFDGNKLTMIIDNIKATYYINTLEEKNNLIKQMKYGSFVLLNGLCSKPMKNTIPNAFNYQKYLKSININLLVSVDKIKINNNNISLINTIKNNIFNKISNYQSKDYIYTFVLGNKNFINNDNIKSYQENGISHLFALSGMHVSLFSVCILLLLKKLKFKELYQYLITIIFLIFYAILTGLSPSIIRSTFFFIFLSFNKLFKLNIKTINCYLIVISLILIIFPYYLINISFQYSSLACFGLIKCNKKSNNYIISLLNTSFIATIYCLPITINNFYEINLLSCFNNIIFVPLITFIVYPLSLISLIIPLLDNILLIIIKVMEFISLIVASNKLIIIIPHIPFILILIYYLILIIYNNYLLLFIIILINYLLPYIDTNYYIYYLDVNQGDSALIITPHKKEIIMIDTGGKITYEVDEWKKLKNEYHIADGYISLLKSRGINSINNVILSHGDADHGGELLYLTSKINIKSITFNIGSFNNMEESISKVINNHNYIYKLNLRNINLSEENNENDNSTITLINIYNYNFLFMGDISQYKEEELLNKENINNITILKLGHHGSKTSSGYDFLKTIDPKIAIISSGRNNRYNHPSIETINNLNNLNINYLNTQINGTIKVTINKNKLFINQYVP